MKLTEISYGDQPPVDSYGPGFFRIAGKVHEGDTCITEAGVAPFTGDFGALDAGTFDILLIGTGAEIAPLPGDSRRALEAAGIAFEPMATPAAARTYNVLLSEGRRVALVLTAL